MRCLFSQRHWGPCAGPTRQLSFRGSLHRAGLLLVLLLNLVALPRPVLAGAPTAPLPQLTVERWVRVGGDDTKNCTRSIEEAEDEEDEDTYIYTNVCGTIARALAVAGPGDVIRVAAGTYPQPLTINKPVTIFGGYQWSTATGFGQQIEPPRNPAANVTTISGLVTIAALTPSDTPMSVTIDGMRLTGGGLTISAPIPVLTSKVTLEQVRVEGNTGAAEGGGIRLTGSGNELDISASTISGNTATSAGGGIYAGPGTKLTVGGNTVISGNTVSSGSGGGIAFSNILTATLGGFTLTQNVASTGAGLYAANSGFTLGADSVIVANTSASNGGGVYINGGAPVLNSAVIRGNGNTSNTTGGGIYIAAGTPKLSNLVITDNNATTGGGIYVAGGSPQISSNTLLSNTVSANGGGMAVAGGVATMGNNSYSGNRALSGNGGGLYAAGGALSSSTDTFAGNQAQRGGGVYITGVDGASLSTPTLSQNHATADGGGLYATGGGVLALHIPTLAGNTSNGNGAGLYLVNRTLNATGTSQFQENLATGNGGGIYLDNNAIANFAGLDLRNNQAAAGGGLYRSAGQLNVSGAAALLNNTAVTGNGGAFHLSGSGNALSMPNLTLLGNAAVNGGGFYASGVTLALGAVTLQSNAATQDGGGAYLNNATLTVTSTVTIIGNAAERHGGGLYATGGALSLATSSTIQDNTAGDNGNGGALYLSGGSANLGLAALQDNRAGQHGGAIYAANATLTLLAGSQLRTNGAQFGSGGAIYALSTPLTLSNVQLVQNSAFVDGGGFFAQTSAVTLGGGTLLQGNRTFTGRGGGGFVTQAPSLSVTHATLNANEAQGDGGGLAALASPLTFALSGGAPPTGATFSANTSGARGGALFVDGGSLSMQQVSITGNAAVAGGGGVWASTGPFSMSSSTISNNNGDTGAGGGIYLTATGATLSANTITGNLAAGGAGLQLVNTPLATLSTDQLRDNTAGSLGGGLGLLNSRAELNRVVLRGNQATDNGGGVYAVFSRIGMTNTLVVRNRVTHPAGHAAGILLGNSELSAAHVTVADNSHTHTQGVAAGIVALAPVEGTPAASSVALHNSIVSGHSVGLDVATGNSAIMQSVLWNNSGFEWTGAAAFTVSGSRRGSPSYVNASGGDYRIKRDSAAFDQGHPSAVTTDRDGIARTQGFAPDLGAHEHRYSAGLYLRVDTAHSGGGAPFAQTGDTLAITLRIRNQTASTANAVVLTVNLPSQMPAPTMTPGTCQGIFCQVNLGNLAPGAEATVVINAPVTGSPSSAGLVNLNSNITLFTANFNDSDKTAVSRGWLHGCRAETGGTVYTSVQAAVDAALTGGLVRISGVCGGVHQQGGPGQLLTLDKTITLEGGWNATFSVHNPSATPAILDSAGLGRIVYLNAAVAPTLRHLNLRNGSASGLGGGPAGKDAGGAVYIRQATPTFDNIGIRNSQSPDLGGGVFVSSGSQSPPPLDAPGPVFLGGVIENNSAGERGGGLYVDHAVPRLTAVAVSRNQARAGGGAYLLNSPAQFIDSAVGGAAPTCVFNANLASGTPRYVAGASPVTWRMPGGGGALALEGSAAQIIGCGIDGNLAMTGGGLYIHASPANVTNAVITANRAMAGTAIGAGGVRAGDGGGVVVDNLDPATLTLRGTVLSFNEATRGAALLTRLAHGGTLALPHMTVHSNRGGPTVVALGESHLAFADTIVATNADGATLQAITGSNGEPAGVDMTRTLWFPAAQQPAASPGLTLVDNFTGDPAFRDDGRRIKRISAAYGMGGSEPSFPDRDGDPRPVGAARDLGADEHPIAGTVRYVALNGTGQAPCSDYRFPCPSLQTAIDAAAPGDFIKMAGGTYSGVRNDNGRIHHARIDKTLTIQGSYFPRTDNNTVAEGLYTLFDWEIPYPNDNPTIIDVNNQGRGLWITGDIAPTVAYLTIRRGSALGQADGPAGTVGGAGGGIYVNGATPNLLNIIIEESRADFGAGIYLRNAQGTLSGLTLNNNEATWGGGLYVDGGQPTLQANTISANRAITGAGVALSGSAGQFVLNSVTNNGVANTLGGGGLALLGDSSIVLTNTVTGNRALHGGGFYILTSSATLRGNQIANNRAGAEQPLTGQAAALGAGLHVHGGAVLITGNTIANNQAIHPVTAEGGGIYIATASSAGVPIRVLDNTITTNRAHRGGGVYVQAGEGDARVQGNRITANVAVAAESGIPQRGGGLFVAGNAAASGHVTVEANTVERNAAVFGAGLAAQGPGGHTITANVFDQNQATQHGGGILLDGATLTVAANTLTGNQATQGRGGGLYSTASTATIRDNTLQDNRAGLEGGGVYLHQDASSLVADAILANTAADGAGIYVNSQLGASAAPRLERLTLTANHAGNHGGGIYLNATVAQVLRSTLRENVAAVDGGGVYLAASAPTALAGNVVADNQAGARGGGLLIGAQSGGLLLSNAIVDNQATTGGGIAIVGASPSLIHTTLARNGTALFVAPLSPAAANVNLLNSIIANHATAVEVMDGAAFTTTATLWDGNTTLNSGAGAFVNLSPRTGSAAFAGDGIRLTDASAAVNAGIPGEYVLAIDIDGEARFQGAGPELGADELPAPCAVIVNGNSSLVYPNLQQAIDAAPVGGELRIAGTCRDIATRNGTPQVAYIDKYLVLRGGYRATSDGFDWVNADPERYPSVLDARELGRVVRIEQARATLVGLSLLNGSASGLGGGPDGADAGGALFVRNQEFRLEQVQVSASSATLGAGLYWTSSGPSGSASVTLVDNIFRNNRAQGPGGALYLIEPPAAFQIRANQFVDNRASSGAGLYAQGGGPGIVGNRFSRNQANFGSGRGGGVYLAASSALLNRNHFLGNSAALGGGLFADAGAPVMTNNLWIGNRAATDAAALYLLNLALDLRHQTFVANMTTAAAGSAVVIDAPGQSVVLTNNILVDHARGLIAKEGSDVTLRPNLWHNNAVNWAGPGTITVDAGNIQQPPGFVNPGGGDYRLAETSAAVDRGINAGVADDFEGQGRPARQGYDLGADEFQRITVSATLTPLPSLVASGEKATLVLQVINTGDVNVTAAISVTLPAALSPEGPTTWSSVAIARGAVWTQNVVVTVAPSASGPLIATLRVTAAEGANATTTAALTAAAISGEILEAGGETLPDPVTPGTAAVVQFRVINRGAVPLNATVRAQLPQGLTTTDPILWTPTIAGPDGVWSAKFNATVAGNVTADLATRFVITTVEGVTSQFTVTTRVARPALAVSRVAIPTTVQAGGLIRYDVAVTNTGNIALNALISNTFAAEVALPNPADGQPWSVALAPGAVHRRSVSATVEAGYTGPLAGGVQVTTDAGVGGSSQDTVTSIGIPLTPTATALGGDWHNPASWQPPGVPSPSTVVEIPAGVSLYALQPIRITGLRNHGRLELRSANESSQELSVSGLLENYGEIRGANGPRSGAAGIRVNLNAGTLLNEGVICAGNGAVSSGPGGALIIVAQAATNRGLLCSGNGANALPGAVNPTGGAGGDIIIVIAPGMFANRGDIRAGDGGDSIVNATPPVAGGAGGTVTILSNAAVRTHSGNIAAGTGGTGSAGAPAGATGEVIIGAPTIVTGTTAFVPPQPKLIRSGDETPDFAVLGPTVVRVIGGTQNRFTLRLLNLGAQRDTYAITSLSAPQGWGLTELPTTLAVEGFSSRTLQITLNVPVAPPPELPSRPRIDDPQTLAGQQQMYVATYHLFSIVVASQSAIGEQVVIPVHIEFEEPGAYSVRLPVLYR